MSIRTRNFELDTRQPLPWGDPYIVKLFRVSVSENQGVRSSVIRAEAIPPLHETAPDFDIPRHQADEWLPDDPGDGE